MTKRTALVTGASRGIGRAIALRLAAAGATVAVHYNRDAAAAADVVGMITAAGGSAFAFAADLADPVAVRGCLALYDAAVPAGDGMLDIVVLNAGISADRKPIEATTEAELDRVLQVNFKAPFHLIQSAIPRLRDGGRVILVSSMATRVPFPELIAYAPTKAALEALVAPLAVQLGPRGITVNAVLPGATETDMNPIGLDPARVATVTASVALRRVGQPDDVADIVAFLASEQGRWVTGQRIDASGGQRL